MRAMALAVGLAFSGWVIAATLPLAASVSELHKHLEAMEASLGTGRLSDADLLNLREEAQSLREALLALKNDADKKAGTVREDLEALGSPPAAGQPPEAPGLKNRRQKLVAEAAMAESGSKEAELIRARLDRVINDIKMQRRERFTDEILTRSFTPLNLGLWAKTAPDWVALAQESLDQATDALKGLSLFSAGLILGALGAIGALRLALRRALQRSFRQRNLSEIGLPEALKDFFLDAVTVAGIVAIILVGVFFGGGEETPGWTVETSDALRLLVFIVLTQRFFVRVLDPRAELMDLSADRTLRLQRVAVALGYVFGLEILVDGLIAQQEAPLEVSVTNQMFFSLMAALILLYLRKGLKTVFLQRMNTLLILAIGASILSGYVALGRLLATRGVLTIALLVGARILFRLIETLSRMWVRSRPFPTAAVLAGGRGREKAIESQIFWVESALKAVLLTMAGLGFLFLWALDRKDLLNRLMESFEELRLGGLTFSPSAILTGLLLFAMATILIHRVQRFLDEKVFPQTRLDSGVRHSIRAGVGYLGFMLAGMLSISVMGVSLQNVAMIAGALSVGIGFGLQNIVNNFVSGLILLVERPIKAGDWVVVGEHQGLVQKISVRATQITTLDHTTVYIPNSSLISGAVQNKTHPDRMGRVVLPLSIDLDQNPKDLEALLLNRVESLTEVRKSPAPEVLITGVTDTQINLEFVAFVQDVGQIAKVRSDLHEAFLDVFKENDIRRKPSKPQEMNVRLMDQGPFVTDP